MTQHSHPGDQPPVHDPLEETLRQIRHTVGPHAVGEHYMQRMRRRAFLRRGLLAGAGLACTGAGLALSEPDALAEWNADLRTRTGEVQQVRLASGTQLTLAPHSAVNFAGPDGFSLRHGTTIVRGAQDRLASVQIETRHGLLEMSSQEAQIRTDHTGLEVLSHTAVVRIAARNGQEYRIKSGERLRMQGNNVHIAPAEWAMATAWTGGQLIVENTLMQDVVEAFRPYWSGPIYISGRAARIPVAGVFSLSSVSQSLEQIAEAFPVKVMAMPFQTRLVVSSV